MPNLLQCVVLSLLFLVACCVSPMPLLFGCAVVSIAWSLASVALAVQQLEPCRGLVWGK